MSQRRAGRFSLLTASIVAGYAPPGSVSAADVCARVGGAPVITINSATILVGQSPGLQLIAYLGSVRDACANRSQRRSSKRVMVFDQIRGERMVFATMHAALLLLPPSNRSLAAVD